MSGLVVVTNCLTCLVLAAVVVLQILTARRNRRVELKLSRLEARASGAPTGGDAA